MAITTTTQRLSTFKRNARQYTTRHLTNLLEKHASDTNYFHVTGDASKSREALEYARVVATELHRRWHDQLEVA